MPRTVEGVSMDNDRGENCKERYALTNLDLISSSSLNFLFFILPLKGVPMNTKHTI